MFNLLRGLYKLFRTEPRPVALCRRPVAKRGTGRQELQLWWVCLVRFGSGLLENNFSTTWSSSKASKLLRFVETNSC